jgi:type II secretory pathway pseudopilin PulG
MRLELSNFVRRERRATHAAAFTLVEIILAIGIAVGLLIVAMLFYRQAADLRGEILQESERVATVRLLLDRMAGDLRAALPKSGAGHEFLGDTGSLSFTKSVFVPADAGAAGGDLVRVVFSTVVSNEGTNTLVSGFDRTEEPLGSARKPLAVPLATAGSTNLLLNASLETTNRVTEPLTDLIRFAHFRYWDGAEWQEGWTNASPPAGVEVVLGVDPLPEGVTSDEYPFEQFRRVVFLPAGVALRKPEDAGSDPFSIP